jgi:transglutaminase-like putative cysteine protease
MRTAYPLGIGWLIVVGAAAASVAQDAAKPAGDSTAPKTRRFQLDYGATLTKLPPGKVVRVWLPVPPSNDYQQVREVSRKLPAAAQEDAEYKYGNRMLYFQTKAPESGEVSFQMVWDIDRHEVRNLTQRQAKPISPEDRKRFLAPDQRVPINDAKVLALLADRKLPSTGLELARALYDRVDDHVTYDKTKPGYGLGDVHWVCDSRTGNCTDFHSLFISMARSKGIPSFFAIGFPLPPDKTEAEIPGYHCWAFFHLDGHGWVPVDISEADKNPKMKEYYFGNLTADRVTFTVGRDLDLVPKQDGEPLNYFIYPYAEVDGKPYNEMQKRFRFKDR